MTHFSQGHIDPDVSAATSGMRKRLMAGSGDRQRPGQVLASGGFHDQVAHRRVRLHVLSPARISGSRRQNAGRYVAPRFGAASGCRCGTSPAAPRRPARSKELVNERDPIIETGHRVWYPGEAGDDQQLRNSGQISRRTPLFPPTIIGSYYFCRLGARPNPLLNSQMVSRISMNCFLCALDNGSTIRCSTRWTIGSSS